MVKAAVKRVRKIKTIPYDVSEQLRTPEEMAAYLDAWLEEAPDDAAGMRVYHELEGCWNELLTCTTQTRLLSFEADHLIYTTPETIDPMDGKPCTYRVEFERAAAP